MRDVNRIDVILDLLSQYWKQNPDLRLSQLVHCLGNFYTEDDDLEKNLRQLLRLKI